MRKLIRYTFLVLFIVSVNILYGQDYDEIEFFPVLSNADIDNDGRVDSLWYNCKDSTLTIKLSTEKFQPFIIYYDTPLIFGDCGEVTAVEGGFVATAPHMRSSTFYSYHYEKEIRKFRLIDFFHEHIHCGTMQLDLEEGVFTGDWFYRDMDNEVEPFVILPEVELYVEHAPIYLGEESLDLFTLGYNLLETYQGIYAPPYTDTVRFVESTCDYDYCDFVYINSEGIKIYGKEACNHEPFYRDDLIEITQSTFFYQEPGDGTYQAMRAITEAKLIESGKMRHFYDTNQKKINFYDDSSFHETVGARREEGADYFFAATDDKEIKKYMAKPGSFDVYISDIEKEEIWLDQWQYAFLMDIFNTEKDKSKKVRTVILAMTSEEEFFYYLYDKKKGKLNLIDVK